MRKEHKAYSVRVRCVDDENTDSVRDYLHEDTNASYPYASFAEAEEALPSVVEDELGEDYETTTTYEEKDGGGFWFVGKETGREGRACVLVATVWVS